MYVYGACCFYVCCSDCVAFVGMFCCVAAVVKDSVFSLGVFYVCVGGVMGILFSVCIVMHGAVGARVWGVCVLSTIFGLFLILSNFENQKYKIQIY